MGQRATAKSLRRTRTSRRRVSAPGRRGTMSRFPGGPRMKIRLAAALVLSLAASFAVAQQQDFSKVEVKAREAGDRRLHAHRARAGTSALSVGEGRRRPDRRPVRAPHRQDPRRDPDHHARRPSGSSSTRTGTATTPAATRTSGKTGALLVAHENVRQRMSVGAVHAPPSSQKIASPRPKAALPVVTFTDAVTFHLERRRDPRLPRRRRPTPTATPIIALP